jgi:hypothetical protein
MLVLLHQVKEYQKPKPAVRCLSNISTQTQVSIPYFGVERVGKSSRPIGL